MITMQCHGHALCNGVRHAEMAEMKNVMQIGTSTF